MFQNPTKTIELFPLARIGDHRIRVRAAQNSSDQALPGGLFVHKDGMAPCPPPPETERFP